MTDRATAYLDDHRPPTPILVMDLDRVNRQVDLLAAALPGVEICYAMKCHPAPEVVELLCSRGVAIDVASVGEVNAALAGGAAPEGIAFSNPVTSAGTLAAAAAAGVGMFSFDDRTHLGKIATHAPGSVAVVRLISDGAGSAWPLGRKFGVPVEAAGSLLEEARDLGLRTGVTFHVGSQQLEPGRWEPLIADAAFLDDRLRRGGRPLEVLNLGGGLPGGYSADEPSAQDYGTAIGAALDRHFSGRLPPRVLIEPGRFLVAPAGVLRSSVIGVTHRDPSGPPWVFVDIGTFGGLIELMDQVIRFPVRCSRSGPVRPCVLAGPTCDSMDVMYEREPVMLPADIAEGDQIDLLHAGAYTTTGATVGFNGFDPLRASTCLPARNQQ